MRKLLPIVIIGGLALFAYQRAHRATPQVMAPPQADAPSEPAVPLEVRARARDEVQVPVNDQPVEREFSRTVVSETSRFHCDGRKYCSQMSSCEEATYFLEHCPGMKMDGDRDGIPCEDQHCGH